MYNKAAMLMHQDLSPIALRPKKCVITSVYIEGARTKFFFFLNVYQGDGKKQKQNKEEQKEWKESAF